jgi:hypothetical protein
VRASHLCSHIVSLIQPCLRLARAPSVHIMAERWLINTNNERFCCVCITAWCTVYHNSAQGGRDALVTGSLALRGD